MFINNIYLTNPERPRLMKLQTLLSLSLLLSVSAFADNTQVFKGATADNQPCVVTSSGEGYVTVEVGNQRGALSPPGYLGGCPLDDSDKAHLGLNAPNVSYLASEDNDDFNRGFELIKLTYTASDKTKLETAEYTHYTQFLFACAAFKSGHPSTRLTCNISQ